MQWQLRLSASSIAFPKTNVIFILSKWFLTESIQSDERMLL